MPTKILYLIYLFFSNIQLINDTLKFTVIVKQ